MVCTRKRRESNRRLLSQLDDFDQVVIIVNAASKSYENTIVIEGTNDRSFTVGISSNNLATNENRVKLKFLKRCFDKKVDRQMSNNGFTVEDRMQNAILPAFDSIVAAKIELAIRSVNMSSGRDATSVTANSEHREDLGTNAPFENASGNNNVLDVSNVNDETRINIPDKLSELSVPETRLGRQTHTHPII